MSCYDYNCYYNCCNYYGYCPEYYSSFSYNSYYTSCWYYYNNTNTGGIAGGVTAGIIVAIILVILFCYCYKQRQNQQLMEAAQINAANRNDGDNGTTIIVQNQPQPDYNQPNYGGCLLYTSPSPRDQRGSRMPSSA